MGGSPIVRCERSVKDILINDRNGIESGAAAVILCHAVEVLRQQFDGIGLAVVQGFLELADGRFDD